MQIGRLVGESATTRLGKEKGVIPLIKTSKGGLKMKKIWNFLKSKKGKTGQGIVEYGISIVIVVVIIAAIVALIDPAAFPRLWKSTKSLLVPSEQPQELVIINGELAMLRHMALSAPGEPLKDGKFEKTTTLGLLSANISVETGPKGCKATLKLYKSFFWEHDSWYSVGKSTIDKKNPCTPLDMGVMFWQALSNLVDDLGNYIERPVITFAEIGALKGMVQELMHTGLWDDIIIP